MWSNDKWGENFSIVYGIEGGKFINFDLRF